MKSFFPGYSTNIKNRIRTNGARIAETLRPKAACGTRPAAGENDVLKRGEYNPYNTRTRGSDVSAFFRDLKGFNVREREAACGFAVMR